MKKIIYALVLIAIHSNAFSQHPLKDGIYLIDQLTASSRTASKPNKAVVQFNPYFVDDDPEDYDPIVIFTEDFVPFELADLPVIQKKNWQNTTLLMQLTVEATEKLGEFSASNLMNYVVVVVNGEALTVHKINQSVTTGLVKMSRCDNQKFKRIYKILKSTIKGNASYSMAN